MSIKLNSTSRTLFTLVAGISFISAVESIEPKPKDGGQVPPKTTTQPGEIKPTTPSGTGTNDPDSQIPTSPQDINSGTVIEDGSGLHGGTPIKPGTHTIPGSATGSDTGQRPQRSPTDGTSKDGTTGTRDSQNAEKPVRPVPGQPRTPGSDGTQNDKDNLNNQTNENNRQDRNNSLRNGDNQTESQLNDPNKQRQPVDGKNEMKPDSRTDSKDGQKDKSGKPMAPNSSKSQNGKVEDESATKPGADTKNSK